MVNYFPALELKYDPAAKIITIPTFRQDLIGMCDIAGEIARYRYGYDKIPTALPSGEATSGKLSYKLRIRRNCKKCGTLLWIFTGHDKILLKVLKYLISYCFLRIANLSNRQLTISVPIRRRFQRNENYIS